MRHGGRETSFEALAKCCDLAVLGRDLGQGFGLELREVGDFGAPGVETLAQGGQFDFEPFDPCEPRIRLLSGLLGGGPLLVELGLQVGT